MATIHMALNIFLFISKSFHLITHATHSFYHIPALTGLLSTLLCLVIFGRQNFLIPAMLCITLVLTILRRREEEPV